MRTIDADKLWNEIFTHNYSPLIIDENINKIVFEIKRIIDNAPTIETSIEHFVDLEQIKKAADMIRPKGKWISDKGYFDCRCSICNSFPLERGDYPELSPYCPQCGAKMEIEIGDYIKKTCLNCKHLDKKLTEEPCYICRDSLSKWEPNNEQFNEREDSKEE